MLRTTMVLLALLAGASPAAAQAGSDTDFAREGERSAKDALEGRPAPALAVQDWIHAPQGGLDLASLRGRVVVLDFWGTW